MDSIEVMKRLRVLAEMPAEKRPISIYRLENLAKLTRGYIYRIVNHNERVNSGVCKRIARALEWVENGQVLAEPQPRTGGKAKNHFAETQVRVVEEKNPPQCIARRVTFGNDGKPKVVNVVYNPAALQK